MNLCQLIIYSRTSTLENNLYSFKQYQTIIISTFKLDIAVAWHIYTEHLKSHSISVYYTAKVSKFKLQRLIIGQNFYLRPSSPYFSANIEFPLKYVYWDWHISCWTYPGFVGARIQESPGRDLDADGWCQETDHKSPRRGPGSGQAPGWGLCRARPQYCLGK